MAADSIYTEVIERVTAFERAQPVDAWEVNGLKLWPLVRTLTVFGLFGAANKAGAAPGASSPAGRLGWLLTMARRALDARAATPAALRRNLLVSGGELNALVGAEFTIQGVRFHGVEECRPCYWMDAAITPGAESWLRGRGGLRCRILSSGWLRRGAP